jgi:hypothetical protein
MATVIYFNSYLFQQIFISTNIANVASATGERSGENVLLMKTTTEHS